jgi:hypothetical protein
MNDGLKDIIIPIISIVLIIIGIFWIIPYMYQDCKRIVHTSTYCVLSIFH